MTFAARSICIFEFWRINKKCCPVAVFLLEKTLVQTSSSYDTQPKPNLKKIYYKICIIYLYIINIYNKYKINLIFIYYKIIININYNK